MKKLNMIALAGTLIVTLAGCSSTVDKMDERLTDEARIYSKSKAVYCGADKVVTYYESEEFISVSCSDGSNKTIFLD